MRACQESPMSRAITPWSRMLLAVLAAGAPCTLPAAAEVAPATLRVDYVHSGNSLSENYALERVVLEPLPWPGNPARPLDDTDRGHSFFEVVDPATGKVLY